MEKGTPKKSRKQTRNVTSRSKKFETQLDKSQQRAKGVTVKKKVEGYRELKRSNEGQKRKRE